MPLRKNRWWSRMRPWLVLVGGVEWVALKRVRKGCAVPGASLESREGGTAYTRRVVVVEDEEFTRSLVTGGLESFGFEVHGSTSVAGALDLIAAIDPHLVVADLDLGAGPSGLDLINRVLEDWPWIGCVVLTSHASVELAVGRPDDIPESVPYVVKSSIQSIADLSAALESALSATAQHIRPQASGDTGHVVVTQAQAEILRLIAEGLSNAGIARRRGTSLRSAESLVQRTIASLSIPQDPDINPRVIAVRMWQQGKVIVR